MINATNTNNHKSISMSMNKEEFDKFWSKINLALENIKDNKVAFTSIDDNLHSYATQPLKNYKPVVDGYYELNDIKEFFNSKKNIDNFYDNYYELGKTYDSEYMHFSDKAFTKEERFYNLLDDIVVNDSKKNKTPQYFTIGNTLLNLEKTMNKLKNFHLMNV